MSQAPAPNGLPAELLELPAPRHVHEYLVRSQHLHFGYFETPTDSLAQAQDRLVLRSARHLGRAWRVADVGSGLGGTVNLLAAQGHEVYGCDPCVLSVAYARTRATSPRARMIACDLADFAVRAKGARFDAVFLTEVLAHLGDLGLVLAHCRAMLRPGGILVVHDVVRDAARAGELPPDQPRFQPRGALRSAADAAGFDLVEQRDVTHRITPTLSRIARGLAERGPEIVAAFEPARPQVAAEVDECQKHWRSLENRYARMELTYEATVLRCSARVGTDSVVLRPRARVEAVVPRPTVVAPKPASEFRGATNELRP